VSDPTSLSDRLNQWTWRGPDDVLEEAARSGDNGAKLLAEQLRNRTRANQWLERINLVVALGNASGSYGVDELREATTAVGPQTTDLRCASLLALAKRWESKATPDLEFGLSDRSGAVRRYAMLGLAAFGTDTAWDPALGQLTRWLKRPSKVEGHPPEVVVAVCYLVRVANAERFQSLVESLVTFRHQMQLHVEAALVEILPAVWNGSPDAIEQVRIAARSWFVDHCNGLFANKLR
jgi:hypothetical protein